MNGHHRIVGQTKFLVVNYGYRNVYIKAHNAAISQTHCRTDRDRQTHDYLRTVLSTEMLHFIYLRVSA